MEGWLGIDSPIAIPGRRSIAKASLQLPVPPITLRHLRSVKYLSLEARYISSDACLWFELLEEICFTVAVGIGS